MASLRPVGRSAATLYVGRLAATLDKDRVSACRFTFADSCTLAPLHFYTLFLSALTHLNATLTNHLTSVDSKRLTANLNPSESTLTRNIGGGGLMINLPCSGGSRGQKLSRRVYVAGQPRKTVY